MTPYLMKVQDAELAEEQSCCLLLAERLQSGYDGYLLTSACSPRHTHPAGCSIIGYLPQDLIGTPELLHLHPSDRPLMLAVHRKKASLWRRPVVGGPLSLPSKAESVVSITSQCSYSSTIVHVGDKKPQPESEIIEDEAENPAPPALPVSVVSPPTQEKEAYKRLGLTKQVLAVHTHKEEQAFLTRCLELRNARTFQKECATYLHRPRGLTNTQKATGTGGVAKQSAARPEASPAAAKKGSRNKKFKKPRMKRPDSSDSAVSHRKSRPPLQCLNQTPWSPSETSQSQAFSVPYPAMVPVYPLSGYPAAHTAPAQITRPDPSGHPEGFEGGPVEGASEGTALGGGGGGGLPKAINVKE
ncbi:hypothetical protein J4Q44_G00338510 [Coregonus suidteri]|uniref:Uncharacterized protein n=1 Tax=Coregonus suidteri TaxID=861788 RepID=A0AAN8KQJ2_9TELE